MIIYIIRRMNLYVNETNRLLFQKFELKLL